jgi:hypothetical protein
MEMDRRTTYQIAALEDQKTYLRRSYEDQLAVIELQIAALREGKPITLDEAVASLRDAARASLHDPGQGTMR